MAALDVTVDETDLNGALSDYARVAKAIAYLEATAESQPELADVAHHIGLSPFHFQRLFRRWAGISPKRFLQFITVEHAKRNLAESQSVLDATFAVGLSGPSRLHDLFVACEAMTPGEFRRQGEGLEVGYGFHPSPFGLCVLALTPRGVCGLGFAEPGAEAMALADLQGRWPKARFRADPARSGAVFAAIAGRLGWTADGEREPRAPVKLHLIGTNFQVKVWEGLLRIPPGCVTSYDALSARIGRPGAARAVAGAVAANPISLLIPCHRVIRGSGLVSGYYWGVARKRAILAWEAGRRAPDEAGAAPSP